MYKHSVSHTHLSHGCGQAHPSSSTAEFLCQAVPMGTVLRQQQQVSDLEASTWCWCERQCFHTDLWSFFSAFSPWSVQPSLNASGILNSNIIVPNLPLQVRLRTPRSDSNFPGITMIVLDCTGSIYFQIEKKMILMNGRTPTFRMNVKQISSVRRYDMIRYNFWLVDHITCLWVD